MRAIAVHLRRASAVRCSGCAQHEPSSWGCKSPRKYADDCNVYVRSRRAGERVMKLLRRLYAGLRLRINEAKSAVDLATTRRILGYSFWSAPGKIVKRKVAAKALATMKENVRFITRRTGGRSIEQVCQRLAEHPSIGRVTSTSRTARCGPACRVVWQGSPEIIWGPYADFHERASWLWIYLMTSRILWS